MTESEIILYDLPSKDHNGCWSLNPWKTRLVLNFKKIPYKTEWLEYPDVAPTLKSFNIPPNESGFAYTIPAIRLPTHSPTHMQDSKPIAQTLESMFPPPSYPSLLLTSPHLALAEALLPKILGPLRPEWMPLVPPNLLNKSSAEYFERTRKEAIGMSLSEYREKEGGEGPWKEAEPFIKDLGKLVKENSKGPYVEGDTASYADFVIVSWLHFMKRIDEKFFERIVGIEPVLKEEYDACKQWLERADH